MTRNPVLVYNVAFLGSYVLTGAGMYLLTRSLWGRKDAAILAGLAFALELGGPTFVHTLDPCPKGWDYHPQYSQELGHLAVETGIWPLYEVIDGVCNLTGPTRQIAEGRKKRKPVYEYLKRQGRFAHFIDEDVEHFQAQVDKMWTEWLIPGVIPFTIAAKDQTILKIDKKPLHEQKTA